MPANGSSVPGSVLTGLAECQPDKRERVLAGRTAADIASFEERHSIQLPTALRAWLECCDGMLLHNAVLYGLGRGKRDPALVHLWYRRIDALSRGWLPIGSDRTGGIYVLATERAEADRPGWVGVLQHDYPVIPGFVVASSLWTFITFILREHAGEERWRHDPDHVLEQDPGLRDWQPPPPLPWDEEEYWETHRDQAEFDAYWDEWERRHGVEAGLRAR